MRKSHFMRFFCALFFALIPIGWVSAATTTSVTTATYLAAYNAASNGDTLLLATGNYANTSLPFPSGKTITLKAAENAKPVVDFCITANNVLLTNGGLIFDSLEVTTTRSYFIDITNYKDIALIKFKNCVIRDIARCLMRSTTGLTGSIMDFSIDNCIIKNCGTSGYNFIWTKHAVKSLSVTNSTLYNYTNGESFFYPNQLYADNILTFKFENNTVYKWAKDATRAICNMSVGKYNAASTYSFKNNIITVPGVDGFAPKIILTNVAGGTLIAQNNLIVNYGTYSMTTPTSSTINDLTLAGLGIASIPFPDPALGNFTIYSNTPLATASTTSGVIGDPRWLVQVSTIHTLTTGLAAGVDVAAGSVSLTSGDVAENSDVSITATKNFGFRFVKWIDENGNTLSTSATYNFVMDANKTVKAVFEAVTTYSLNVISQGAGSYGKVTISGTGVSGRYENGSIVSLTAISNEVIKFSHWDNLGTDVTKNITITSDTTITANFNPVSYIASWDFDGGLTQSRPGDYLPNAENIPTLGMYSSTDNALYQNWRNNTVNSRLCASFWKTRTSPEQYYYFQTMISTTAYKNITVKYGMRGSFYGNDTWNLMYSFDGVNFTKAFEHPLNMSGFVDYTVSLPSIAGKANVYLRWAPDATSPVHGSIADVDGTYISAISILADANTDNEVIWSGNGTWNTPANWSTGTVPASASNVLVGSGSLTIDQDATVANLTINPGSDLTLATGNTLTVTGNFSIKSNLTNGTGTFLDNGTTTVSGTTNVEQYLTGAGGATPNGRGWYVSSPVTEAKSSVYSAAGTNQLWSYSESANGYTEITDDTTTLAPMQGYFAKVGASGLVTYTGGRLNNGEISNTNLTRTGVVNPKRGYHLIGNPYPSMLDWNAAIKSNVRTTMWFRTLSTGSSMVFDSYNTLGSLGTNNNGRGTVTQHIPPMQAFWVKVEGDGNTGTLTFNNSMRSHQTGNVRLLRQAETNEQQVLRLQVSNGINSDEAIIAFSSDATDELDAYDSPKMTNNNIAIPEIFTMAGNERVVINGLNGESLAKELALGFKTGQENTFTMKATEIRNFGSNARIILKDKLMNTQMELTDGSAYNFTSSVTNAADRFSISITKAITGIQKTSSLENISVIRNASGQVVIKISGNRATEGIITIFSTLGQKIKTARTTGQNTVLDADLTTGIYLVSVNVAGQKATRKLVIN